MVSAPTHSSTEGRRNSKWDAVHENLSSRCFWADALLAVLGPEASGVGRGSAWLRFHGLPARTHAASMCFPLTHCREQAGQGDSDSEVTPLECLPGRRQAVNLSLHTMESSDCKSRYTELVTRCLCLCHRMGASQKSCTLQLLPMWPQLLSPLTRQGSIVHSCVISITLINPSRLESQ